MEVIFNTVQKTADNLTADVHAPLWTFLIIAALCAMLYGSARRQ